MGSTRENVSINSIQALIEITGKTAKQISLELGHTSCFLNNAIRDAKGEYVVLSKTDCLLIRELYAFEITEQHNKKEIQQITPNELYKLIYGAVYSAVKTAWEDEPEPGWITEELNNKKEKENQ